MTEQNPPGAPRTTSRPASHFQRLYQADPDPWGFAASPYEQAKYRATVAALEDRHFTSGLEVGCSIGVLTRMLAPKCDRLLGIDIVDEPLADARARCADQPQVEFKRMRVPAEWPARRFDLIVFSEVLYFLSAADIQRCAERAAGTLLPGGTVLLVNWLGRTDDPSPGAAAPDRFIAASGGVLTVLRQQQHESYRMDVLAN